MTTDKDKARARQAKGSVQEAIGKIIGNAAIAETGLRERKAGARQADAEHLAGHPADTPIDKNGSD